MSKLAPRQKEYCEYLLMGLKSHEIAELMGISLSCVKQQAQRIALKLRLDLTKHLHVQIVTAIHDNRADYGVKCQACGEL